MSENTPPTTETLFGFIDDIAVVQARGQLALEQAGIDIATLPEHIAGYEQCQTDHEEMLREQHAAEGMLFAAMGLRGDLQQQSVRISWHSRRMQRPAGGPDTSIPLAHQVMVRVKDGKLDQQSGESSAITVSTHVVHKLVDGFEDEKVMFFTGGMVGDIILEGNVITQNLPYDAVKPLSFGVMEAAIRYALAKKARESVLGGLVNEFMERSTVHNPLESNHDWQFGLSGEQPDLLQLPTY